MATRQSEIDALLHRATRDLESIQAEYRASLTSKEVPTSLKIDIKRFCGDLRSVLDYMARDIEDKYTLAPSRRRPYFPLLNSDRAAFMKRVDADFPGLKTASCDLWRYLESVQPYHGDPHRWVWLFNVLNNDNKHDRLTPQQIVREKRVHVDMPGGSVSWSTEGVTFGSGVSIGGVPVDPATQRPVPHPSQTVKEVVWVDFQYDLDGEVVSALQLLKNALDRVAAIAAEIRAWL
jgi:hypothetical protein